MGRLKKVKFTHPDDLEHYHDQNKAELFELTLSLLEKHYSKHKCIKTVDILEVEVENFPQIKYVSVLEKEWKICLNEIMGYSLSVENYMMSSRVRDLLDKIKDEK